MAMLTVKDPDETIMITFDFSKMTTEVPVNPYVEINRKSGAGTKDPIGMLLGAPVVNGQMVGQLVKAGEAGDDYTLRCGCEADIS